jgi:hypothetical protein
MGASAVHLVELTVVVAFLVVGFDKIVHFRTDAHEVVLLTIASVDYVLISHSCS